MVIGGLCVFLILTTHLLRVMKTDFKSESVENLTMMTEVIGKHFKLEILERIQELEMVEKTLSKEHDQEDIFSNITNTIHGTEFDHILYVDTYGYAYSLGSDVYTVAELDFYDSALAGNTTIGVPTDLFFDTTYMPIVIPVQFNGVYHGQLIGLLSMYYVKGYIESDYIDHAVFYLATQGGDVITFKYEDDYNINELHFMEYSENTHIFNQDIVLAKPIELHARESGTLMLDVKEEVYCAAYYMTEFNDWYLVTIVEEGDLLVQFIEERDLIIAAILIFTVVLVNMIIVYMKRTSSKHLKLLEDLTYYDKLTGLPNEVKFQSDMKDILSNNPDKDYVIAVFDVVDFKDINELYGFQIGDEVLCLLAERINKLPIDSGFFGKGVKDEFWCFDTVEGMTRILETSEYFEHKMSIESTIIKDLNVVIRYGAYYIESNDEATLKILENAQFAHTMAKKNNQHVTVFNVDVKNKVMYEKNIINRQESALVNREFIVYLQPKYLLENESIVGAEALVRWVQVDGELLNPAKFIPIFEKNGFIVELDMFVLEEVCKIIRNWLKIGVKPVKISVNFSRCHLTNMKFVEELHDMIERYEVPKEYIELELTETVVSENVDHLVRILEEVHERGLTIAIDDFGSGYSSLGILRKMKFDVVKLDRSFLWDYENEERSKSIIRHMIDLSKDLCAEIVAEGVERKEDVTFLKEVGCDMVQGYFFAKPMIHHEFTDMVFRDGE